MPDGSLVKLARTVASVALAAGLVCRTAIAAEPASGPAPSERERAATAYDEAVRLSSRAEYELAARRFLEADAISPNADALSNAIAAARRANAHLLVAEAAGRAISRQTTEPDLAARARVALAEAERHLSRLELSCRPAPCEIDLDRIRVASGRHYALPGVHVANAIAPNGARREERFSTVAGTEYAVMLEITETPQTPTNASAPVSAPTARTAPSSTNLTESEPSRVRPLPPWVFYAGLGTTVALGGVTAWSGIDTLNAKADLPNPSTEERNGDVTDRARRTDFLLGGTLVVAAASAVVGLVWVDWGPSERMGLTLTPVSGGAVVGLGGAHR